MPPPTRIILVRHGQTTCNVADLWHGWDDCALTDEGLRQARATGDRLAAEPVDAVYSSDSRRALQTAAAIAAPHGLEPIADAGLRERHAGRFEGLGIDGVLRVHPTVWEDRAADYWGWRPPDGESFHEVMDRSMEVVDRIRWRHPGGTVVIVTHMGPARVLLSRLGGVPLKNTYDLPFPSTGVSIFSVGDDEASVETVNDAAHIL